MSFECRPSISRASRNSTALDGWGFFFGSVWRLNARVLSHCSTHYLPCLNLICLIFGATFHSGRLERARDTKGIQITIHSCSGECKSHNTHTRTHDTSAIHIDTWSRCGLIAIAISVSFGPDSLLAAIYHMPLVYHGPTGFWSNKNCQNVCRMLGKYLHAAQGYAQQLPPRERESERGRERERDS